MTVRGQKRASGEPGAIEEARTAADEMTDEVKVDLPEDQTRKWRTPAFQRMRFQWRGDDAAVMSSAQHAARQTIANLFGDAYALMHRIYEIVRDPVLDDHDEIVRDAYGFPEWKRQPDGWYVEDFSRLTRKQREDFLGSLVTALFAWEQQAAILWSEAMFAKAQFEERFAIAYDAPMTGTVDDRRAAGNKDAAEERYFAIYVSTVSKMADALVRSMDRLQTRLKDLLAA
jgi:hypothetical protein